MATGTLEPTRKSALSGAAPAARVVTGKKDTSLRTFNILCGVFLGIFAVLWLIPSLWALRTSLTPNATSALGAQPILNGLLDPSSYTTASYAALVRGGDIWNWYLASAITSIVTVVLVVVTASMAAYPLARLRFRGRRLVMLLLVGGLLIPPQVLIVPIFQELNALRLLNTYWAVIFPQVPAVIAVFVFMGFFNGLPRELEESARIDGASFWTIYRTLIMPLSRPVISAMAIVTFVGVWNNLILPLFVLSNPKLMTIPVGLATVQGSYGLRYSDIQASTILGALPVIILFLLFQRRIIQGIAGTGLKG